MTAEEHARDLVLRLSGIDGTPDEIIDLIVRSLEQAVAAEREHWKELLDQHAQMSNEAAGLAVAAERERCAEAAYKAALQLA